MTPRRSLCLNALAAAMNEGQVSSDPRYAKLKGRHILIVEDEVLVAMMMEDILLEQGCTPEVAGEQKAALACIDGGRFDAAILDVNLNGASRLPRRSRRAASLSPSRPAMTSGCCATASATSR